MIRYAINFKRWTLKSHDNLLFEIKKVEKEIVINKPLRKD